jgi:hypothetical protein
MKEIMVKELIFRNVYLILTCSFAEINFIYTFFWILYSFCETLRIINK